MKKLIIPAMLALAATAAPALAQSWNGGGYGQRGYGQGYDQGYGRGGYQARIERLAERIQRAGAAGYLDRGEYRQLSWAQRDLRNRLYSYSRGGLNDWERRDLDQRIASLRERTAYAMRDERYGSRDGERYGDRSNDGYVRY